MTKTTNKDVNKLIKEAEAQGWVITYSKSLHLKWVSPSGGVVFTSSSPSDHRVVQNIRRDLRLNGFVEIKRNTPRKKR